MDCLEGMKLLPDNSVDSIVTDPPYELGFMGKQWDSTGIAYNVDVWKECLRVLKPGGHLLSFGGSRTYHRMACAIEDAGFEIRDQIMWIYGCLSEDTECLTIDGWKKYTEITKDTLVLQWNSSNNELSWVTPNDVMAYPAPKSMVNMQNRHTDQMLTPNHRVYGRFRKHSRNEFPSEYTVEHAGDLKKHWIKALPLAGKLQGGISVPNAYLVGWWMSDAWKHGDGKACMFSQSKVKTLDKLRKALVNADCKFSEYTKESKKQEHQDEHTFYVTGNLAEYLLENFSDREITMEVISWDFESRMALLEGLLDGDGSRNQKQHSETFWSKNSDRLDVVQALCLSLNIRSHINYNKGCVYLNRKTNETQVSYTQTCETVEYNGDSVWCVNVPNGAFVVRRNGRAFITGNSGFPKSYNVAKGIEGLLTNGSSNTKDYKNLSKKNIKQQGLGFNKIHLEQGDRPECYDLGGTFDLDATTPEAIQWNGWGTAIKPSHEPIVVARKPLSEKTVAANVLKWGTGGINIDVCRVGTEERTFLSKGIRPGSHYMVGDNWDGNQGDKTVNGRFPANVIFDEEAGVLLDKQSGGASRFFYCAKASKKDRGEGNIHPTVKPTALMEYLIKLVTPPNGTVLDPFAGSGTTLLSASELNYNFLGFEMDENYCRIATTRISAHTNCTKVQEDTVCDPEKR